MQRFFTEQTLATGRPAQLERRLAKHIVQVLRHVEGDQVELVDATETVFIATIQQVSPLIILPAASLAHQVELPVKVALVCGISKGDKSEWITQKATELGADSISFFNATYGTARWAGDKVDKKLARLALIATGAAEQSHRRHIPTLHFYPNIMAIPDTNGAKILAYEESAKAGEASQLYMTLTAHPENVTAIFGPEGGIAPVERDFLREHGYVLAGLGPRILRAETAPLYFLSAVSVLTELKGK